MSLPGEMDVNAAHATYPGRVLESRQAWNIEWVGDCIPIEPPIAAPAGSFIVTEFETGEYFVGRFTLYIDGKRTAVYRLRDGAFRREATPAMNEYERLLQLVVTTGSGLTMTLEAAGEDHDGNQLWRQVGSAPPESVLRSGGQLKQYGPRPRIATARPKDKA